MRVGRALAEALPGAQGARVGAIEARVEAVRQRLSGQPTVKEVRWLFLAFPGGQAEELRGRVGAEGSGSAVASAIRALDVAPAGEALREAVAIGFESPGGARTEVGRLGEELWALRARTWRHTLLELRDGLEALHSTPAAVASVPAREREQLEELRGDPVETGVTVGAPVGALPEALLWLRYAVGDVQAWERWYTGGAERLFGELMRPPWEGSARWDLRREAWERPRDRATLPASEAATLGSRFGVRPEQVAAIDALPVPGTAGCSAYLRERGVEVPAIEARPSPEREVSAAVPAPEVVGLIEAAEGEVAIEQDPDSGQVPVEEWRRRPGLWTPLSSLEELARGRG